MLGVLLQRRKNKHTSLQEETLWLTSDCRVCLHNDVGRCCGVLPRRREGRLRLSGKAWKAGKACEESRCVCVAW